jgi:hypothetical protein
MSFEFEEDVSSGTVLKLPCFEDMNEHELTQYKLHDAVLKQDVTELRDLLSLGGYDINEEYALEVQKSQSCHFKTRTLLERHLENVHESIPEITKLLIKAGANVNLPSPDAWHVNRRGKCRRAPYGEAPLFSAIPRYWGLGYARADYYSVEKNPWENMRILLDAGADPTLATSRGDTPLLLACSLKCIKSARILLKYGARPNMEDDIGRTALTAAAYDKYPELIELLFEFGADPDRPCTYMTKRVGSLCAGVDTCAALFKFERVRRAKLEYNNIKDTIKTVSYGMVPRVLPQTHMGGLSDMMRDISLHIGYISMEDRLLAIDEIAAQELHEYSTTYAHYWDEYDQEIADEMAGWGASDDESGGSEDGSE